MTVDWPSFTPWSALMGGLLIGLATAGLLMFNGRIAGISGIVGGLLSPKPGDVRWRAAFVLGLLMAPTFYLLWQPLPDMESSASMPALIVAGLLVGLGTRYGSGCTSGHGVCGLSRLSPRSAVATACFMAMGFVMVYVVRHLL
jgi:uncharacterized protein